jgi:hypothetical protein
MVYVRYCSKNKKHQEDKMSFPQEVIQAVWEKGKIVPGYNPNEWRKDECNAWIGRNQYGNRESKYGWEIDHIRPISAGGSDYLINLRPLQWENNCAKQDHRLVCVTTSYDNVNRSIGA